MLWQKNLTWEKQFDILEADGVDFVPYNFNSKSPQIIESHTREEMLAGNISYPKCNYEFWKWINGYKCYLVMTNEMK